MKKYFYKNRNKIKQNFQTYIHVYVKILFLIFRTAFNIFHDINSAFEISSFGMTLD